MLREDFMLSMVKTSFAGVRFTRDILSVCSAGFYGKTHYRFLKESLRTEELFSQMLSVGAGYLYCPGDSAMYTSFSSECERIFSQHTDIPAQDFSLFSKLLKSKANPLAGTRGDAFELFEKYCAHLEEISFSGAEAIGQICQDAETQKIHIFMRLEILKCYKSILEEVSITSKKLSEGTEKIMEKSAAVESVLSERLKNECNKTFVSQGQACYMAELTAFALKNCTVAFKTEYDLAYRYSLLRQ